MSNKQLTTIVVTIWLTILLLIAAGAIYWFTQPGSFSAPPSPTVARLLPTLTNAPKNTAAPSPTTLKTARPSPSPLPTDTPFVTLRPKSAQSEAPVGINPLTGLPVQDLTRLDRNPLAVKITNFPRRVRAYQYGLMRADVVYEYYIEDGLTRFIAVFYGQDAERAGPVRSGRYFDEHVARMYQAYLVFANADERVEKYFMESDLRRFLFIPRTDNCPPLCRDNKVKDYNNVFVDTLGVTEFQRKTGHETKRVPLRLTYFNNFTPLVTNDVNQIFVRYSSYSYHYWQYDPTSNNYLRWSDAVDSLSVSGEAYEPHIDILTGEQVAARNLVVLVVQHNFNNEFDRADQLFNISLINDGLAYIFKNGHVSIAYWKRDAIDQPIKLEDEAGNPAGLLPGNTFYIVIDPETSLVQNETTVRFSFFIPDRSATPTPTPFGFEASPTPKKRK